MAGSEFYDHTTYPSQGAAGSSSAARAEFELIETAFGKIAGLSGNGGKAIFVNSGATAYEAVTASQARTNLGLAIGTDVQAYDADLAAIAALTSAANKVPYSTGAQTWALSNFTAGGRALVDSAGTADTFPYFSASDTVTLGSITSAGRALLDDADAAAQLTTLGAAALAGSSSQDFSVKAITEKPRCATYVWTSWAATDLAGTLTNAPSTAASSSTATEYMTMANSSGTLTITFTKAGVYKIDVLVQATPGQAYTTLLARIVLGGTATLHIATTTISLNGAPDTTNSNVPLVVPFTIVATTNQTLTLLPKIAATHGSGAASNFTGLANVSAAYMGTP